ncbi:MULTISPECIES: TetR/AcrR family transcriptional regulator [Pseudomonas]|uniref:TetR/AcrR family transcriptional regulator n=1 Tax=Pseudomonas TaxID=286 RepID=UPI001EF908B2|nr:MULTISPECIES: TetR/AcrR family transcriptional regulator [Pseudomonas]UQI29052.1 TetR/AcrR family transcriptional regulator [Pseudomonas bijieensis]WLH60763.1 TetR/AcrR family transcriptional regulator [Pseudomonas sp. FP2300]
MPRPIRPERIAQLPPRERIIDAAQALFFEQGISRVTVDAIAALAGSTKMTLYRHFETKDVLVQEWLRLLTEQYSAVLDELSSQWPGQPVRQLLGFAEFIAADLASSGYRGCPFTNSLAELPDPLHPARRLIESHKQRQFQRLATLCKEADLPCPMDVAQELTLLMEGAQVVAQNKGMDEVGARLMRIVSKRLGVTV